MRISEVANRTGLNVSNIRFYERKGLLNPERKEDSKYRDYTEEDVHKIKRILLYRKMGISIETIYLLLNEKIDEKEVLLRQQNELQLQMNTLQGAMELCSLLLKEETLDNDKLDQYLNYVYEEEHEGKMFAEIEELLDDLTDYTKETVFYSYPILTLMFQKRPWVVKTISVLFWGILIAIPILHLLEFLSGNGPFRIISITCFLLIILIYSVGFFTYRKKKRRKMKGVVDDGDLL